MTQIENRTAAFEAHQNDIREMRRQAVTNRTEARCYNDIADELTARPSQSAIADSCVADVAATAREWAATASSLANALEQRARDQEARGIDG